MSAGLVVVLLLGGTFALIVLSSAIGAWQGKRQFGTADDPMIERSRAVDGTAEVLDLPEALEPLVEYFRVISGEHSDWDEYREAMLRQGKCLIRLTAERWGPIATGGFPARLA